VKKNSGLKSLLIDILQITWIPALQIALIILTLTLLPNINLLTFILTIVVYQFGFKLIIAIHSSEKPSFKDWIVVSLPKTIVLTSLFVVSISVLGLYGLLGIILILVLLAAWRIAASWKLFDSVTSWGAAKIKGYKGSYDIKKEAEYYDKQRKRTNE
jgi:hypothetical protein